MRRKIIVFLVFFAAFSLVYSSIGFYALSPRPSQPFMGFGVFSENGLLSGYVNGTNPVMVNRTFNWHLDVTNRMGVIQYVGIVYRIGNGSTASPTTSQPASVPQFGIADMFIANGETGMISFAWSIISKNETGGSVFPNLMINGQRFTSPIGALSGRDFRLIFELWTFDVPSSSFQYGWKGPNSRVGSWLQVWFNVAL